MNVTIALNDQLVQKAREYAAERQTTLNGLVRQLLESALHPQSGPEGTFQLMDLAEAKPMDGPWRREDVYRERLR
jgi:hypothetical protein